MNYKVLKQGTAYAVGSTVALNVRQAKYLLATGHIEAISPVVKANPVKKEAK